MDNIRIQPAGSIGRNFIPAESLPAGKDEYYLRNIQNPQPADHWRKLTAGEIKILTKNRNNADNWDSVLVSREFDPKLIRNTNFFGLVRIGRLKDLVLEHHDLQIPAGITNSTVVSCDIGDDTTIHNVSYLAYYIIGDRCILTNVDEMITANYAKFGNGILKEGEPESSRIWLDVMNEAGCRKIIPFDGMIPADAYLWARYRDDEALMDKFLEITQKQFDSRRGYYGTVGSQCVIKNSRTIKNVKIGSHCFIKGANKLKNLTINSSPEEPAQIGEGVEMINGIVSTGCLVLYGCKAVRFVLGNNVKLKYGARVINSVVGDNSTIACCEVLNNLIFPAHEQHHNNSFLIASLVMGQSNIAAGSTIGSNHNSRSNDNEVHAGRGFWPGLCTSVKHPSRFASFTLLAKGDYPGELDIPLPFSLLNDNSAKDRLDVIPAFWWLHNMYALARNASKFQSRDKRIIKTQHIEFDPLAPDTAEEILRARRLLEIWTGKAGLLQSGAFKPELSEDQLAGHGRQLLNGPQDTVANMEILAPNTEKSRRKVVIQKAYEGYRAYGEMLLYYAIKNLTLYLIANSQVGFEAMRHALMGTRQKQWINLGGQLAVSADIDRLRADINSGNLAGWQEIHQRYDMLWQAYPLEKQKHAFVCLCELFGGDNITKDQWLQALHKAVTIQNYIRDQVYLSRKKDYDNPFLHATFRNPNEMHAAIGTIDDNSFVKQIQAETEQFQKTIEQLIARG